MGEFLAFVVTVLSVLGLFVLVAWFSSLENSREAEAIQRGYALHCPQTGEFAWKGECDE